jgi:hypothetical protein
MVSNPFLALPFEGLKAVKGDRGDGKNRHLVLNAFTVTSSDEVFKMDKLPVVNENVKQVKQLSIYGLDSIAGNF